MRSVREAAGFAALTFDDGFEDNLTTLLPLLEESGVPATVFVVSGWLGRCTRTPPRRAFCARTSCAPSGTAASRSARTRSTHPDLSKLGYEAALSELAESKAVLEAILEASVEVAAYPFGRANRRDDPGLPRRRVPGGVSDQR